MIGIAAAVALLAWFLTGREAADRSSSTTDAAAPGVANGTAIGSGSAGSSTAGARGQPYGVPVPAVAEAAHSQLIYTLLSAAVIPLGNDTSELRLRFRFSNEGWYPANAWDSSFRLVTGNETLAPTGGLNDLVAGHSLKQGIVVFTIPASTGRAVLRVVENTRVADIPLDLSPTGRPAEDEKADAGDALSRAIIRSVLSEPRELVSDRAGGLSVTLTRGTTRRFANVLRVRFALRYAYAGNYSTYTGAATLRIAAGDQLMAPIEEPSEALGAQSTVSADMEFELPPDTKRAVLRGTIGKTTAEWAFDVPQ